MNISRARHDRDKLRNGSLADHQAESPSDAKGWVFLPYGLGLLQAYAQGHANRADRYDFHIPVHRRMPVDVAVNRLLGSDIAGFSTYVWNYQISLEIARRLKEAQPETLIVFGGPHVPDHAETFLRQHTFIDVAMHGEGERSFTKLLDGFADRNWSDTASISYLDGETFVHHPKGERIRDLDSIPPVYSSDLFRPLMDDNPGTIWGGLVETNRGCPFACTFCDWGSATNSKVFQFSLERIEAELDWIGRQGIEYIFSCDANFGMLPRDVELAELICRIKKSYGFPKTFATQNTKNSTERSYKVQSILHEAEATSGVTLAFQSLDEHTLESVKRANISIESFSELQQRYTRARIPTYTDIILALPGESYASFVRGISRIIAGGQHNNLSFYNCSILPNAEMADPDYIAKYGLKTVEQEIVEVHADLDKCDNEEVREFLPSVITTKDMPAEDWVRAKGIWWMSDLVYFGRLLQIPFVLLHELHGQEYGRLVEVLTQADRSRFPLFGEIMEFFNGKARRIQQGGWEYCASREWLNLAWPANQYALIKIVTEGKLDQFYAEAKQILIEHLDAEIEEYSQLLVSESIDFNRKLFRVPGMTNNLKVTRFHNIWEFYQGVLDGLPVELEQGAFAYGVWRTQPALLRLEDWLEHVVFCQNVKRTFLYPVVPLTQPARSASDDSLGRVKAAFGSGNSAVV